MGNHIYILDTDLLKDPGLYACCCSRVPRARREKAAACRYESDRRLSLGAGILLTEGLVRAGLPEAEIASSIVQSEKGKPCLAGSSADRVHFNLSHSGILAVCAVSAVCSAVCLAIGKQRAAAHIYILNTALNIIAVTAMVYYEMYMFWGC